MIEVSFGSSAEISSVPIGGITAYSITSSGARMAGMRWLDKISAMRGAPQRISGEPSWWMAPRFSLRPGAPGWRHSRWRPDRFRDRLQLSAGWWRPLAPLRSKGVLPDQKIDPGLNELLSQTAAELPVCRAPSGFQLDGLAFDIAKGSQLSAPFAPACMCHRRPRCRRATNKSKKFPSLHACLPIIG